MTLPTVDIVVPILNQPEWTRRAIDSFLDSMTHPGSLGIYLIDNGSTPPLRDWDYIVKRKKNGFIRKIIRFDSNQGLTKAYNSMWPETEADFVWFTHNDVLIEEQGYDVRLRQFLAEHDNIGVVGLGGSPGLGAAGLYQEPYSHTQLGRHGFFSNMRDAEHHGTRITEPMAAAVHDGFSLIISRSFLESVDGFDQQAYPIHHMYDNDICLTALCKGMMNWVLPIACHHNGGVTSVHGDYQEWAMSEVSGGDPEIYLQAHRAFYDKWRGVIPVRVTS